MAGYYPRNPILKLACSLHSVLASQHSKNDFCINLTDEVLYTCVAVVSPAFTLAAPRAVTVYPNRSGPSMLMSKMCRLTHPSTQHFMPSISLVSRAL